MRLNKKQLVNGLLLSAAVLLAGVVIFLSLKIVYYLKDAKRSDEISAMLETAAAEPRFADSDDSVLSQDKLSRFGAQIDAAQALNPDVAGWIQIDGTSVSYPVLKGDNNIYYLKHNLLGESSSRACIMMDAAMDTDDPVILLYGHHMRDGSMFHDLTKYKDVDYLENHPEVGFETRGGYHAYRIFAVLLDRTGKAGIREKILTGSDMSDLFLSDMAIFYDNGFSGGQILVLTTCTYETSDASLYIFAAEE